MKEGFDNKKYVKIQSEKIRERFKLFDKLYLEVGGKLFDDSHAARVLPGFKNDAKISMFKELKDDLEIIFCINAGDIEKNKTRGEYGITYDAEVLRLINASKKLGFYVDSVVITLYKNQVSVDKFIKKLERNGIKTYIHTFTKGYPTDVETIVSEEGYGANPYIETTSSLASTLLTSYSRPEIMPSLNPSEYSFNRLPSLIKSVLNSAPPVSKNFSCFGFSLVICFNL